MFPDEDRNLLNFLAVAVQPASILMPIVGILLVSSEWTQRTAMITFALVAAPLARAGRQAARRAEPRGDRVRALPGHRRCSRRRSSAPTATQTWSLSAGLLGQVAFSVAVPMLIGIGFGAVLLSSAPAIVLYFVLPTALAALGAISALEGAARWLDQSRTMAPMLEETLSATQWARVATSLALWLALPIALGFWRVARSDVR